MPTSDELSRAQKTQWSAAAGIQPGDRVLDLACGAGQPSATAAERVRPGGTVTATDLSPDMVPVTKRKVQTLGLDNLRTQEMDTQALSFADATFDAAICRFGLMFCPDPVKGASEIRRVRKPGARVATAVWDVPAGVMSLAAVPLCAAAAR